MPAIGAVAGLVTAIAGTAVGSFIIQTAVGVGLSFIASKIFEKQQDKIDFDQGIKSNALSTTQPIPVVYGTRTVGGSIVYQNATGTTNQYLHLVFVLSEGECDSLIETYVNDVALTGSKYQNYIRVNFHTGAVGQAADPDLVAEDTNWTGDHRLHGVCYAYVRLIYSASIFDNGRPTFTFNIKGKKIFDPRTETIAWSDNPALCIRDYLAAKIYGRDIADDDLDDDEFIAAANHCDEEITVLDGEGSEIAISRYLCNGVVNTDNEYLSNLDELRSACRGWVTWSAGKYGLKIDKTETATFNFNASNILGAWNFSPGSKKTRFNRVRCSFFNQDENWEQSKTNIKSDLFYDDDNQVILESDISLRFTSDATRAKILAQYYLKQSRQGLTASFTTTLEALQVEVGDVVTITHEKPGWEEKQFRVHSITLKYEDTLQVVVGEYDPSVYTFDLETPPTIPDTNLPDPFAASPPQNIALSSGTDQLLIQNDGTIVTRLLVEWDPPPSAFVTEYEVAHKLSTNTGYTVARTSDTQHYITGIRDGANFDVRVRSINAAGSKSAWIEANNYTIIGKTEPPQNVTGFNFRQTADYSREFSWAEVTDPDLAGYVIRYSSTLTDDWDDMTPLHIGVLTASPWQTQLLNAGTYRFAIRAKDTTGNLSNNARYLQAELTANPSTNIILAIYPHLLQWPGTKTDAYVDANNYLVATDQKDWSDFATDGDDWGDWTPEWLRDSNSLIYEHDVIDLGSILTFRPNVSSVSGPNSGAITYQEAHSDDNVTFTSFATITGEITARYVKIKLTIAGTSAIAKSMTIEIGAEKVSETINDLDTSTLTGSYSLATGNIRLPIQKTYSTIKNVTIVLQNTGAGWSWELIDKNTTTGPQIKIYNATPALADATLDATIEGY